MKKLLLILGLLTLAGCVRDPMQGNVGMTTTKAALIDVSASTTVSLAVDIEDYCIVGLDMPATFTGTALTFQSAVDNEVSSDWDVLYDASNVAVTVATVAQGRDYDLTQGGKAICGQRFIKVVSGSAEGADRTINLILGR